MKFCLVHFDGGVPQATALLGGHVDGMMGTVGSILEQFRGEKLRVLGVMTEAESKFLPFEVEMRPFVEQARLEGES